MTEIIHSAEAIHGCFCVNINVKQRWINPLVRIEDGKAPRRIADISETSAKLIKSFLEYEDTPCGCVRLKNS